MPTAPPLTPMSMDMLLGRVAYGWESRQRIFELPSARIWKPADDVDLSIDFLGRRAATPIGPAAGPHSQMAQNIVLAWLGGARLFELKTVQVEAGGGADEALGTLDALLNAAEGLPLPPIP